MRLIVALNQDNIIGNNNNIPWKVKYDLQRFKQLTNQQIIVMGRKTYESLPIKPLKNRMNIVITNNPDDYEGGEFDLELFEPEKNPRYKTFKLKKGSAIFFQSDVWHRVRPVSSGARKSLVAWYSGPTFK